MKSKACFFHFMFFVFLSHLVLVSTAGAANKIMPLGDSITRGIAGSTDDTGYRRSLYFALTGAGYTVDFVGSLWEGIPDDFDKHHEGHGGWTAFDIIFGTSLDPMAGNLADWLAEVQPEIVLLHIGTNGLTDSSALVETILNMIDAHSQNVWVVLARIVNRHCITFDPSCTESVTTMNFNINVGNMAQNRISSGDKILIVDMENGAGIDYHLSTDEPPGDMADWGHPFDTGYDKMADLWFFGLTNILPQADAGPDLDVYEFDTVALDASGSMDPKEGTLTYQWVQTAGAPVVLSDDQAAQPTFDVPDVGPLGEILTLTFMVTVTDTDDLESTDIMSVNVINCPGDFNNDNDVDGMDLAEHAAAFGGLNLNGFSANFGKTNCLESIQ